MAKAGYCRSCGTNVYLTCDGGCPRGHGPGDIENPYDAPDPVALPADARHSKPGKNKIVLIVVAVVLLACCAITSMFAALGLPVFNSAQTEAEMRSCFANQRVIEGAALMMYAKGETFPSSMTELVDEGYIAEVPACLTGGEYIYSASDGTVYCTEHGHYE